MHQTGDRHAVLGLGIVDGVAADERAPRLFEHRRPAAQHLSEQVDREGVSRPADHLERRQRSAAHRIHIAERIGRGNAPPVVCLVDDWGEEVHGLHQRDLVGEAVDARVVRPLDTDKEVLVAGG